ncbi:hypothetical protein H5T57_02530 [Candidatus Bipolaricaulota bacterium]|nr:hypothetical protein [Candidatus Bipolaricaulota bacterium]
MEDRERAKNGAKADAHPGKYDIHIFDSIGVCCAIPDKKILDDPFYQSIYLLQILVFYWTLLYKGYIIYLLYSLRLVKNSGSGWPMIKI